MTTLGDRRSFLTGSFRSRALPLRPPGSAAEADFQTDCTACGDCLAACPRAILIADAQGRPVIEPARGGCTFCNLCIEACPTDALVADRPWLWRATVKDACLAFNAIACRSCEDFCESRAIRFRPRLGGISAPTIDATLCTGCAECAGACPASSITMIQISPSEALAHV